MKILTDLIAYEYGVYRRTGRYLEFECHGNSLHLPKTFQYLLNDSNIRYVDGKFVGTVAVKGWETNVVTSLEARAEYINATYEMFCLNDGVLKGGSKIQDTHGFYNNGKIVMITSGELKCEMFGTIVSHCSSLNLCVSLNKGPFKTQTVIHYLPDIGPNKSFKFSHMISGLFAGDEVEFKLASDSPFELANNATAFSFTIFPTDNYLKRESYEG